MTVTRVDFYRHGLGEAEKAAVSKALDELVLTTGATTKRLEAALADYLRVPHVVGLDSCTAALHLALEALYIGDGDEVIVPAMTFVASANAVLMAGATPVLCDVDARHGCMTVADVEPLITSRTRAIMPVHLYGRMCDMRALRCLADRHGLAIVEDAAHCVEAERDGIRPGALGDAACFSFYATKAITCGEGGALATRDPELAERVRRLALHGMTTSAYDRYARRYEHWDVPFLGWKYNLDNIRAALLLPQVPALDGRCTERRAIAGRYEQAFRDLDGIETPLVEREQWSARHLFPIWVDPGRRDAMLMALQDRGVGVAVNYRAIHLLQLYRERFGYRRGDLPRAERIGDSTISLPLYPGLNAAEVAYVIDAVRRAVTEAGVPSRAVAGTAS